MVDQRDVDYQLDSGGNIRYSLKTEKQKYFDNAIKELEQSKHDLEKLVEEYQRKMLEAEGMAKGYNSSIEILKRMSIERQD